MKAPAQYGVWTVGDENVSYWELYDSLEDAVDSRGGHVEVYRLTPKRLGLFRKKIGVVRVKARKKKEKK